MKIILSVSFFDENPVNSFERENIK